MGCCGWIVVDLLDVGWFVVVDFLVVDDLLFVD